MTENAKVTKYLSQGAPVARLISQFFNSERYRDTLDKTGYELLHESKERFYDFLDLAVALDEKASCAKSTIQEALLIGVVIGLSAESKTEIARTVRADLGRSGGKRSVEKRKAALKEGWHRHARALALEVRAENPKIGQRALAAKVRERWKEDGFEPGPDALLLFVRSCEADGSLPRRAV